MKPKISLYTVERQQQKSQAIRQLQKEIWAAPSRTRSVSPTRKSGSSPNSQKSIFPARFDRGPHTHIKISAHAPSLSFRKNKRPMARPHFINSLDLHRLSNCDFESADQSRFLKHRHDVAANPMADDAGPAGPRSKRQLRNINSP